jgi:hypothetical protein
VRQRDDIAVSHFTNFHNVHNVPPFSEHEYIPVYTGTSICAERDRCVSDRNVIIGRATASLHCQSCRYDDRSGAPTRHAQRIGMGRLTHP